MNGEPYLSDTRAGGRGGLHMCMIFEALGAFNAIGRLAMLQVEAALAAGWRVTAVANRLDPSLEGRVTWRRLYNPPRGFAVKWLTARHFIRRAMGDPKQYDAVQTHQPQVADLADVFHCHFVSRMAAEAGCLGGVSNTLRGRLGGLQHQLVLPAEDRCFRRFNPETRLVLVSELLREGFARLYGTPPKTEVILNPAPPVAPVSEVERHEARERLLPGADPGLKIAGFVGGMQGRKGFDRVMGPGLWDSHVALLAAGQGTESLREQHVGPKGAGLGLVEGTHDFLAAVDVLLVPSRFDPCPIVVMEAVARGVPVVVTDGVGNGAAAAQAGAGVLWDAEEPLDGVVRRVLERQSEMSDAALAFAATQSVDRFGERFVGLYDQICLKRAAAGGVIIGR